MTTKAMFIFPEASLAGSACEELTLQYNPEKLQLDRTVQWKEAKATGNKSSLEYTKTAPATLTMELMFDTSINGENVKKEFVDIFSNATMPNVKPPSTSEEGKGKESDKQRPQKVEFNWPPEFQFVGFIKSLKTSYIMFSESGVPIRAKVNLTMQEYESQEKIDHGLGQVAGYNLPEVSLVQVQSGQSLSMIAAAAGTSAQVLADMNGISNPLDVAAGTMLMVPYS